MTQLFVTVHHFSNSLSECNFLFLKKGFRFIIHTYRKDQETPLSYNLRTAVEYCCDLPSTARSTCTQRCQETGNREAVSQGRLSRYFHSSRRIVPSPRKKNASFVENPTSFTLSGFSIIRPGVLQNTGIFTPCPRSFCQGCLSRHWH